jgi:hypothetical protein
LSPKYSEQLALSRLEGSVSVSLDESKQPSLEHLVQPRAHYPANEPDNYRPAVRTTGLTERHQDQ